MRFLFLTLCVLSVSCVEPCVRHSDCPDQLVCQLGGCVMPAIDGDVPEGGLLAFDGATDGATDGADAGADSGLGDSGLADSGDASIRGLRDVESLIDVVALDVPLMDGSMDDVGVDAPDAEAADAASDTGVDANVPDSGLADAGDDT